MTTDDDLRAWARGSHPLTAATELLIHCGLADHADEWVKVDPGGRSYLDFDAIPDAISALPGGQQRLARIAVAIVEDLGDNLAGLDYEQAQLALTALAHATGYGNDFVSLDVVDGEPRRVTKTGLGGFPT